MFRKSALSGRLLCAGTVLGLELQSRALRVLPRQKQKQMGHSRGMGMDQEVQRAKTGLGAGQGWARAQEPPHSAASEGIWETDASPGDRER